MDNGIYTYTDAHELTVIINSMMKSPEMKDVGLIFAHAIKVKGMGSAKAVAQKIIDRRKENDFIWFDALDLFKSHCPEGLTPGLKAGLWGFWHDSENVIRV